LYCRSPFAVRRSPFAVIFNLTYRKFHCLKNSVFSFLSPLRAECGNIAFSPSLRAEQGNIALLPSLRENAAFYIFAAIQQFINRHSVRFNPVFSLSRTCCGITVRGTRNLSLGPYDKIAASVGRNDG
jgi:hypothetical protein